MAPKKGGKRKAEWGDPEATPPVKARRQVVVFQAESEDDSVLRMWDGLDPRDDNSGEPQTPFTVSPCHGVTVIVLHWYPPVHV